VVEDLWIADYTGLPVGIDVTLQIQVGFSNPALQLSDKVWVQWRTTAVLLVDWPVWELLKVFLISDFPHLLLLVVDCRDGVDCVVCRPFPGFADPRLYPLLLSLIYGDFEPVALTRALWVARPIANGTVCRVVSVHGERRWL